MRTVRSIESYRFGLHETPWLTSHFERERPLSGTGATTPHGRKAKFVNVSSASDEAQPVSYTDRANCRMPTEHDKQQYPLYLYEFRYRDPRTGKWRKARYRAEVDVIRQRPR